MPRPIVRAFHVEIGRCTQCRRRVQGRHPLQERNHDRDDSDGRPNRDPMEIREWAREHHLPCDDKGHVQFPDVRIEYDIDSRDHTLEVGVMTPHYRGAHAAAKSGSGFAFYFSNRSGGGGRGGGRTPKVIKEALR